MPSGCLPPSRQEDTGPCAWVAASRRDAQRARLGRAAPEVFRFHTGLYGRHWDVIEWLVHGLATDGGRRGRGASEAEALQSEGELRMALRRSCAGCGGGGAQPGQALERGVCVLRCSLKAHLHRCD